MLGALSAIFLSSYTVAAPLTPGDRDYIQNQQQQRLQQDQQQRDALWNAAAPQGMAAENSGSSSPCFPVNHIMILCDADIKKPATAHYYALY